MTSLKNINIDSLVNSLPLSDLKLIIEKGQERLSKEIQKTIVLAFDPYFYDLQLVESKLDNSSCLFLYDLIMNVEEMFDDLYDDLDITFIKMRLPDIRDELLTNDEDAINYMKTYIMDLRFPPIFDYIQSESISKFLLSYPEYTDKFVITQGNLYDYVVIYKKTNYTLEWSHCSYYSDFYIGDNNNIPNPEYNESISKCYQIV